MNLFYRKADAAKALGVSKRTIDRWVESGRLPAPVQLSDRVIGWPQDVLNGWLASRQKETIHAA